jgi:dUTP pyrophosphatase
MNIQIKKLKSTAILPEYQTAHAAASDLCACIDEQIVLKHGEFKVIPTGIAIALPDGYEAQIRGRSGNAAKYGISVVHGVGTIDADYRGELGVILINHGQDDFVINHGDRIAQMIIAKCERAEWEQVEELDETERAHGGFGSTGTA